MIESTTKYLYDCYSYYTQSAPVAQSAPAAPANTQNTNHTQGTNIQKRAISYHPEYLNILEPFNASDLQQHQATKNLKYSKFSIAENSNVYRVFQNTQPTAELKLQRNMVQKVTNAYSYTLMKEATTNKQANNWVQFSYFSPYRLVMKNTGNDLANHIEFWINLRDEFTNEQDKKLENNEITKLEYDQAIAKYNEDQLKINSIIFKQIIEQLIFLQERNIFYFDIKPHNITIDNRGIAKLIDFSCNVLDDLNAPLDKQIFSFIVITLEYAPPDSIIYPTIGLTHKAASWSLGITLLHALDPIYRCFPPLMSMNGFNRRTYTQYIKSLNQSPFLDDNAKDLIIKLLDLNPLSRISLQEALQHPFFNKELCRQGFGIYVERQQLFDQLCEYESCLEQQPNKTSNYAKSIIDHIQAKEQEIDFLDTIIAKRS